MTNYKIETAREMKSLKGLSGEEREITKQLYSIMNDMRLAALHGDSFITRYDPINSRLTEILSDAGYVFRYYKIQPANIEYCRIYWEKVDADGNPIKE